MNEIEKEKKELSEAFQFCIDYNLFYKDELEKKKDNPKRLLLECVVRMRLYLAKHPEETKVNCMRE
ncbi:MAG: hypothetical protein K6F78_00525 [Bacteroidaceae bacterium]|nr:hypothetical protein [Bacteroidaceae bacterium]